MEIYMLHKNILMMTLLSSVLVTVNAQEQVKPSPVSVAKTAFGATLPAANPIPANPQVAAAPVNTAAPNPQVAQTARVAPQPAPVAVSPTPTPNAVHSASVSGNSNIPPMPTGEMVNGYAGEVVQEVSGIDETTHLNNEAIRNIFSVFASAINSSDNAKMMSVTKEQAFIIGSNQELVSNKKKVEEYFPKVIGTNYKFERIGFTIEPGTMVDMSNSGDTAKVYGRGTEKYKLDNMEHTVSTRWSATVVKEGEYWKIASFHSGVNFADNSVVQGFEEFGWKIGVAAGLIGLFIGFFLAIGVSSIVNRK
jgi:ketosteroid isomerase-like protein